MSFGRPQRQSRRPAETGHLGQTLTASTEVSELSLARARLEESSSFFSFPFAHDSSPARSRDTSDKRSESSAPVPNAADSLPRAPCACGSRTFFRTGHERPWCCAECARRAGLLPLDGRCGEWCSLPPSCRLRVLSAEPPGSWLPDPFPDEPSDPHHPQARPEARLPGKRDPTPAFDDAAHRAMRRDLRVVVEDLAASGKRPGQIARMFGLKRGEVR